MPSRRPEQGRTAARVSQGPRMDPWAPALGLAILTFLASIGILIYTVATAGGRQQAAMAGPEPGAPLVTASADPPTSAGADTTPRPSQTAKPVKPTPTRLPSPTPEVLLPATQHLNLDEDPELEKAICETLGDDLEHTSVVVRRLSDGREAMVAADRAYYAASTFKLAILYEAERRRSRGELNLDDVLTLSEEDYAEDLGTISEVPLDADGRITVRAALEAMITLSDNAMANVLLHFLGGDAIDRTLRGLGLTGTSVNKTDLPTTAADMALLMQAIIEGRGVSAAARDEMRGWLEDQHTRDGIPSGLPRDVVSGNKTGTWSDATHDIAFVEAPGGTYVIAVLSDQGWKWAPLKRVSASVYEAMTRGR